MAQNQSILKYSNKIITLLLLCFVAVMMAPRGNLAPWSFNNGRGMSQIESFTELLKTEKRAFDSKNIFAFDPDWEDVSPFIQGKDGFSLRVNIGGNTRIFFPPVLNSRSPIKIRTRNNTVKQYLSSGGTYRGELVGRYLVYRGKGKDILYRYDTKSNELREFVYLPKKSSLNADGEVIRWTFEGAKLSLENDGNVRLIHSRNPSADLAKLGDDGLQSRISRFLDKRNLPLSKRPIEKTLFVIPRPDYIDGNLDTLTKGINYQVVDNQLRLVMDTALDFTFPLWVDPSLRADADADVILNGQSAGDSFGFSLASAGDFNGDGIDDIIVGAYNDDIPCGVNCGNAFIFFGNITGTKRADADADVILQGQKNNDFFGHSVASAGDFNGDGKDDVIVGAFGDDNNGSTSGSAFIFFGGITGTKNADADANVIINGGFNSGSGDNLGFSVASAGDFNGDGKGDVIVGAPLDDNNSQTSSGSAFIFFGGITGTKGADADADVILNGQSTSDNFGRQVASAGDFNGDGKGDVIVGAQADDNNSQTSSGSAFIFFGGITGTKRADADADVILNGQSTNDNFGASVASAGDFNGDGKSDVIVGAPLDDNNSETDSGSAFIFFGGITGTKRADADADVTLNGQSADDRFSASVSSAGDFNGDGKDDVIVGARLDDNNSESDSGSAFIFFGGITGTKRADADADVTLNGQSAGDEFGAAFEISSVNRKSHATAFGDFNGDGASDVIVGASLDDNNSATDSGSAFVFFSSSVFPSITFSDSTSSQSEDITEVTIPVTLSKTSSSTVTVDFAVTSTATGGGVDFTLASGTLTFSAGTTTQNISFTIVDDLEIENTETITITLSSPTSSIFVTSTISTHTFSITDDDSTIYITHAANTRDSSRLAISPYAQAVPNDSYTFIGVSHPSLDTAATQIGLVIEAIGMRTTLNNKAGRAAVFTVDAGETHRVFIVNQSHPTINSSNTGFHPPIDKNVHLIPTVDTAQFGSIRVTTLDPKANTAVVVNGKNTYKNLAQLSMWGVIYMESTGSGFAMEFIGDMHDSSVGGNLKEVSTAGRGIN